MGAVTAASAGDIQRAKELADRAVARDPSHVQALFIHGALSVQMGEHEAALPSLRKVLKLEPSNWRASTNLASALLQLERPSEAAAVAERTAKLEPRLICAHMVRANALRLTGDLPGALVAAREALRLHEAGEPQPAGAVADAPYCVTGEILVDMGELQEAWSLAVQAAQASGDARPVEMGLACTLAGRVQEAAGQYEQALDAYAKATKLDPSKPRASGLRTAMITKALRACLPALEGDVFISTFPKSGTTWMQQVVCMLCGEPADVDIQMRAPYIEAAIATSVFSLARLRAMPTPRIFKTHAAWADLPVAGCSATAPPSPHAQMVIVVRDPRDVMVSLYYHSRSIKGISYQGSFDAWFEEFVNGTAPLPMAAATGADGKDSSGNDWFEHTLGWWRVHQAHPSRVLWVRYEDLLCEPLDEVRRVARHVLPGVTIDEARLKAIVAASSFGEMKKRHEADKDNEAMRNEGEASHFRKGKAGDWRAHLSDAQAKRFRAIMAQKLAGSGLEDAFDMRE